MGARKRSGASLFNYHYINGVSTLAHPLPTIILAAGPYTSNHRRISQSPLVLVFSLLDKRLVNALDSVLATQYTASPVSTRATYQTRTRIRTYQAEATNESNSAIMASLLAPLTSPLLICTWHSRIRLLLPTPACSSTFLPRQSE